MAASTLFAVMPVSAQGYHYGYGTSRVVNQNNIGLHDHDSSYISGGCISDSAKGKPGTGLRPNKLLPQVNWGRTIRTSGDHYYQRGGAALEDRTLYLPKVIVRKKRRNVRKRKPLKYYQPGDNASGGSYSRSGGTYKYNSGGTMSYGESDNYKSDYNVNNRNGSYSYGKSYKRKSR